MGTAHRRHTGRSRNRSTAGLPILPFVCGVSACERAVWLAEVRAQNSAESDAIFSAKSMGLSGPIE